jgi:hypothetical protein
VKEEESAEGFLSRWSRRKRQAVAKAPPPAEPAVVPAVVPDEPPEAPPLAAEVAAPGPEAPPGGEASAADGAFDPASLPPVESLTAESDLRPFMQPRVPAALRQAAMRRMWSLDPVIRDFVGPADYAWDFNAPDGVPGFALELGGDIARLLAQAIGEPAMDAGPEVPPAPGAPPMDLALAPAPEAAAPPVAEEAPASPPATMTTEPPAPPPRRHGGARPA